MTRSQRVELLPTEQLATEFGAVRVARLGPRSTSPPFVFVHGYPDNLQIWSKVVRLLAPSHDVVAFDWPGLGWSDPLVDGATPFHLGRHFIAVLDALDIDEAIPVGFDMGGHAVVAAAVAEPERIAKLVLTNFLALGDEKTSWEIDVMRRLGLNRLILRYAARLIFRRAERTFLVDDEPLPAGHRQDMWDSFRRPAVRDRLTKMSAGYQASLPRLAKLYDSIQPETLVLWADRDPHFPLTQGTEVAATLRSGQFEVLDQLSHWFMWDDPQRVADCLQVFADE